MGIFQTIKEKLSFIENSLPESTSVSNNETNDLLSKMHNANSSNLDEVFNSLQERENKKKEKYLLVIKQQEEDEKYKVSLYKEFIAEVKAIKDDTLKEEMLDNYLNNLDDNDLWIFYFKSLGLELFETLPNPGEQKYYYIEKTKERLIPSYLQKKKQEIYNEWINSEKEKIFNLMKNTTTESDIDNLYEEIKNFKEMETLKKNYLHQPTIRTYEDFIKVQQQYTQQLKKDDNIDITNMFKSPSM